MSELRVLEFTRDPEGVWTLPDALRADLSRRFPDVRFGWPTTLEEAERLLPEAEVVFGWAVRPRNFSTAGRLRWVHVSAAGVGALLFPALVESQVVVTNGRGLHADAMAEHTLGVLFAFARKLHLARDAQRERRWTQAEQWTQDPPFGMLAGSTLGVVGFGQVGRAIGEKARALGVRVIAVRRHPAPDPAPAHEQWGVEALPRLLGESDAVVLAAPLTADTQRLIGAAELERLRPHAVLVNLGRGALVDEAALIAALESRRLAGAALDVFEQEPLAPGSPLWSMPQVIVTPHTSGMGPRLWERAVDLFAENLGRYRRGEALLNRVDKRAGY